MSEGYVVGYFLFLPLTPGLLASFVASCLVHTVQGVISLENNWGLEEGGLLVAQGGEGDPCA